MSSSNRPSPKLSRLVAERARWKCEYCLSPNATSPHHPTEDIEGDQQERIWIGTSKGIVVLEK